MLQMFDLDVSKVDRVLHLPPRLLLPRFRVSSPPLGVGWASEPEGDIQGCSERRGPPCGAFFYVCKEPERNCSSFRTEDSCDVFFTEHKFLLEARVL